MKTKKMFFVLFVICFFGLANMVKANDTRIPLPPNEVGSPYASLLQLAKERPELFPNIKNWANLLGSVEDENGTRLTSATVRKLRGQLYLPLNAKPSGKCAQSIFDAEQAWVTARQAAPKIQEPAPEKPEPTHTFKSVEFRGPNDRAIISWQEGDVVSVPFTNWNFGATFIPSGIEITPLENGEAGVTVTEKSGKQRAYKLVVKGLPAKKSKSDPVPSRVPVAVLAGLMALLGALIYTFPRVEQRSSLDAKAASRVISADPTTPGLPQLVRALKSKVQGESKSFLVSLEDVENLPQLTKIVTVRLSTKRIPAQIQESYLDNTITVTPTPGHYDQALAEIRRLIASTTGCSMVTGT